MPVLEKMRNDKVASILKNPELSRQDRIAKLRKLRDDARAAHRGERGAGDGV